MIGLKNVKAQIYVKAFAFRVTQTVIVQTILNANGLEPDQDRHSIGPDLGPNSLQRLSA